MEVVGFDPNLERKKKVILKRKRNSCLAMKKKQCNKVKELFIWEKLQSPSHAFHFVAGFT